MEGRIENRIYHIGEYKYSLNEDENHNKNFQYNKIDQLKNNQKIFK